MLPLLFLWKDRLCLQGSKHIRGLCTGTMVFCLQQYLKSRNRTLKIQGNQSIAFFKPTTATLKLKTTQLHCLPCYFSIKETGRGKQRYQRVGLNGLLSGSSSHMLHADTASGIYQPQLSPGTANLKYWTSQASLHLLILLFPFFLWKFKLASFGNRCREKSKPSYITQANPGGFFHCAHCSRGLGTSGVY